jgi:alpha-tubulin suppressor-like RCC1 family protein
MRSQFEIQILFEMTYNSLFGSMVSLLFLSSFLVAIGQSTSTAESPSSISSGYYHTCVLEQRQGIDRGGGVRCFGQTHGEAPPGIFKKVSSGNLFSCALRIDNTVSCWGTIHGTPENTRFKSLSSGRAHACGIRMDGSILCWGESHHGEIDAPTGQYKQVSCGNSITCGLSNGGSVTCFGKLHGMEVPSDNSFIQISAGQKQRICGILSKGDVKCWGSSRRDKSCESKEGKKIFLLF